MEVWWTQVWFVIIGQHTGKSNRFNPKNWYEKAVNVFYLYFVIFFRNFLLALVEGLEYSSLLLTLSKDSVKK